MRRRITYEDVERSGYSPVRNAGEKSGCGNSVRKQNQVPAGDGKSRAYLRSLVQVEGN